MQKIPRQKNPTSGWTIDYNFLAHLKDQAPVDITPSLEDIEWVILELSKHGYLEVEKDENPS